jgi:hypothetical protein
MSHFLQHLTFYILLVNVTNVCIIRLDRKAFDPLHVLITEEVPVCFLFMTSLEGALFKRVVSGYKMHCHSVMHQQPVVPIQ